ncbi:MAG: hypothetical protein K7J46_17095 [Bryobacter sp.]|nr:hypothetical protein [Bryobacter sp. CoA8 C33]
MATPHQAMSKPGSAAAQLSNCSRASSNQKLCSMATARLKQAWVSGFFAVTGKSTIPTEAA